MSKYLVLGGAGAMGQIAVQDLADTAGQSQITVADFDFSKGDRIKALLDRPNVSKAQADVKDHDALVKLIAEHDCIINATPYYFNTRVMKATLEAGRPYLDLGGLFHMTNEQLALNDQFKEKGVLAIVGMGATPGTTNVLAEAAAREMDKVHTIDITCGSKEFSSSSHPFYPPYMLDTMLDEYTLDAMVFEAGELKAVSPTSGEKMLDFPEPIGRQSAIYTLHSEIASMPESYKSKGIQNVTFRLALEPEFHEKLKLLTDLGFGDTEKVTTEEGTFTPRKLLAHMIYRIPTDKGAADDMEILLVDVHGEKDGRPVWIRMEERAPADTKRQIGGGDLNTGVPPSVVAQMIVNGEVKGAGVMPPERVIDPQIYFDHLGKRNMTVTKTTNLHLVASV